MNTRLQVEHPVTELVTGLDLVQMQLRVAAGEPLGITQEDVAWRGSAIECRIYAEDPANNFMPSPGRITQVERPTGPGIRLDSGIYPGWVVPLEYDPLLAKLAVWAESRPAAIARMKRALYEYYVAGITTNVSFFRQVLEDEPFKRGHLHTGFIDEFFARRPEPQVKHDPEYEAVAAMTAAIFSMAENSGTPPRDASVSPWLADGRRRQLS
jgi:acetyl-CoA carboxylase biotin carboxylase subunit